MKNLLKSISFLLAVALLFSAFPAFLPPVPAKAADTGKWIATWSTSLVDPSVSIAGVEFQDVIPTNSTLRTEIVVTTSGSKLRFTFSNQYGKSPLTINGASVAKTEGQYEAKIVNGTQTAITFGGNVSVVIPAGQRAVSDVVDFPTKALDRLSISIFVENTYYISSAGLSNGRTYMNAGGILFGKSRINEAQLPNAMEISLGSGTITYHTIPFLEEVDSLSPDPMARCAVFIGDSTLVNDTYLNYARRIVSAGRENISVINKAIIGNKLLSNGNGLLGKLYGEALIDRFKRDVLEVSGVKYCFVKIGLNDVLHQYSKTLSASTPKYSADDIIAGYKTLINLAHQKGISIYFFTKSAWKGYQRSFLGQTNDLTWNAEAQKLCDELTQWAKTNTIADGVIDCSSLADPSDPVQLCSTLTLDGAHLSDLGAVAMADLIPLEYVGIVSTQGRTAASILSVDPYQERNEIINRMNATKTTAPAAAQTPQTTRNTSPSASVVYVPVTAATTAAPATTAKAAAASTTAAAAATATTAPVPESTTAPAEPSAYIIDGVGETEAAPVYYPPEGATNGGQEMGYRVYEDGAGDEVTSIGSGAPIAFILIFLMILMVAAAVVILTVGKKREFD